MYPQCPIRVSLKKIKGKEQPPRDYNQELWETVNRGGVTGTLKKH